MEIDALWIPQQIEGDETFLRHISAQQRKHDLDRNYKFPDPGHFALRDDIGEDSLSLNWERYADSKRCFEVLGLTHGKSGDFLEYSNYVFFRYPLETIKSIPKFEKIVHDPTFNGNPSPVGKPNNLAHTLLYCGSFDLASRSLLSRYCQGNLDSQVALKIKSIRKDIEELKQRAPNIPHHKNWDFSTS